MGKEEKGTGRRGGRENFGWDIKTKIKKNEQQQKSEA